MQGDVVKIVLTVDTDNIVKNILVSRLLEPVIKNVYIFNLYV